VVRVYFATVADLRGVSRRDTFFIRTDERVKVGDELGLQLAHPDSEDIFEASCFVGRVVDQHGIRGIDVELLDLDEERRMRLRDFVDDGLEALFDEESILDADAIDPDGGSARGSARGSRRGA
jgi:hypothetical protein